MSDPKNELNHRSLEAFPSWLRTLPADVRLLSSVVEDVETADAVREPLAAALNYLFKSVDLIADGIEDLGYVDDAFVLRVAVSTVDLEAVSDTAKRAELERLAVEAELIGEFMADDFTRMTSYVAGLGAVVVRGRNAASIVTDAAARREFVGELSAWAAQYVTPSFEHDENNLVKLRSFLGTKLPA